MRGPWKFRLLVLLVAAVGLTACETTPPPPTDPSRRNVSTLPWNRPASWEGGGMLGSQLQAARGY